MTDEPCASGCLTCLTCPLLGPDWRAEIERQIQLPRVLRDGKVGHRPREDARTLTWLSDDWQRVTEIARQQDVAMSTAATALRRLRRRCPEDVQYSRDRGYRRGRVAA